ncbi:MAG: triose-phosphate isomerase [Bacteroidota bacterium]
MRKQIAAGNWKMNLSATEALTLVSEIMGKYKDEYSGSAQVIFSPSYPYLVSVNHLAKDHPSFHVAAQNVHQEDKGAFTGEISASMLASIEISHCIIGHSERRQYFGEGNALLAQKVDKVLAKNISPIFCIGETLAEREAGQMLDIIRTQVSEGLFHLSADQFQQVILAYEPVWAIGTGVTASPEQAQEVHAFIRKLVAEKYTEGVADETSILYGGSVKAHNASELFSQPDIDGGLVGGASLKSQDFVEIIKALP